ncbi:MAG: OmpH family outer membrane protein [Gemmataceae bacterium]
MNKSVATLAVCVLVGTVAIQALAQPNKTPIQQTSAGGAQPGAAPSAGVVPVRVAVLNTNKVLKSFNKAQQLNNFISAEVTRYGQAITAKRDEIEKLKTDLAKNLDPTQSENIKKRMVQLDREMQDLDAEARKEIGSRQGTIAVDIYKNIEDVVSRVAAANGFDLVLAYPDATAEADMYSQANVSRKLTTMAAIPLYYKRHIDLSDAVITTLNQTYPAPPPAVTPAGATAPAPQNPAPTGGMPKR